eukprot:UN18470
MTAIGTGGPQIYPSTMQDWRYQDLGDVYFTYNDVPVTCRDTVIPTHYPTMLPSKTPSIAPTVSEPTFHPSNHPSVDCEHLLVGTVCPEGEKLVKID